MILEAIFVENMHLVLPDVDHIDEIDAPDLGYIDNSKRNVEIHMYVNKPFYLCSHFQFSFEKLS